MGKYAARHYCKTFAVLKRVRNYCLCGLVWVHANHKRRTAQQCSGVGGRPCMRRFFSPCHCPWRHFAICAKRRIETGCNVHKWSTTTLSKSSRLPAKVLHRLSGIHITKPLICSGSVCATAHLGVSSRVLTPGSMRVQRTPLRQCSS
jgi:hypothetical protein